MGLKIPCCRNASKLPKSVGRKRIIKNWFRCLSVHVPRTVLLSKQLCRKFLALATRSHSAMFWKLLFSLSFFQKNFLAVSSVIAP